MIIETEIPGLRARIAALRASGKRIVFVPTMGNLHAGHYALIRQAARPGHAVVASIFVNPAQFGPGEDFASYPRTPEADAAGLAAAGCDLLFQPDVQVLYPPGAARLRIDVGALGRELCGAFRPGHFDGVALIVTKLFNIVQPDVAIFGQKDYQQLLVIRALVAALDFPVRIEVGATVREADGLAMSSRNGYLDADQRRRAPELYATLCWMAEAFRSGTDPLTEIEQQALLRLRNAGFEPDYASFRRASDLGVPQQREEAGVVLAAARLGRARLIDNLLL